MLLRAADRLAAEARRRSVIRKRSRHSWQVRPSHLEDLASALDGFGFDELYPLPCNVARFGRLVACDLALVDVDNQGRITANGKARAVAVAALDTLSAWQRARAA
jgi:hypothetical protein